MARKTETFNLRLGPDDRRRLDSLARHYSAPAATTVRILIKREFDRVRGARGAKKGGSSMRRIRGVALVEVAYDDATERWGVVLLEVDARGAPAVDGVRVPLSYKKTEEEALAFAQRMVRS